MSSGSLDYITIKGFKSIASIERLELKPINIVIGPNGSGKSNFVGVFSFLHAVREGHLGNYVVQAGGAEKILHLGSKITKEIQLCLSFEQEMNRYEIRLAPTADDALFPKSESASYWNKLRFDHPYSDSIVPAAGGREAGISKNNLTGFKDRVRQRLGSWRVYHLHDTSASSPMRKTAKIDDNAFLRPDGSNLAAFLYFCSRGMKPRTKLSALLSNALPLSSRTSNWIAAAWRRTTSG